MALPAEAPRPWRPSGVVTLLTDYGLEDPYVGIVKGVLLRDAPRLRMIVDLCHAIPAGDVAAAAFLLERSWSTFPAGTVHLAVVDPGVGTERALLSVETRGHVFLGPDNGLLAPLIASEPMVVVRRIGVSAPVRGPSTTFDGRDRFAPLAARLVEGDPPAAFGEPLASGGWQALAAAAPRREKNGSLLAEVVHVDRFGNLITNLPFIWLAEAGADWRERWSCALGTRRLELVRTYGEAPAKTPVALANSYDRMEIALARGNAAEVLGLGRGAEVRFVPRAAEAKPAAEKSTAIPPAKVPVKAAARGKAKPRKGR
jgi:S-adenosyl-L-methionine hydrolase (adenosine-forming)